MTVPITVIVDSRNFLTTYFMGNGEPGAASGMLVSLFKSFRDEMGAERLCAAWDGEGETARHKMFKGYKAKRKPKPPEFFEELKLGIDGVAAMDFVESFRTPNVEADDLVAALWKGEVDKGNRVVIVSRDKDFRQLLIKGQCSIITNTSRIDGMWAFEFMTEEKLANAFHLTPRQWPMYQAIVGDSSDGYPGVKGCGDLAAMKILGKYGDLATAMTCIGPNDLTKKQLEAFTPQAIAEGLAMSTLNTCVAIKPLREEPSKNEVPF